MDKLPLPTKAKSTSSLVEKFQSYIEKAVDNPESGNSIEAEES